MKFTRGNVVFIRAAWLANFSFYSMAASSLIGVTLANVSESHRKIRKYKMWRVRFRSCVFWRAPVI